MINRKKITYFYNYLFFDKNTHNNLIYYLVYQMVIDNFCKVINIKNKIHVLL